jgi:uncharacterized membrane protein
MSDLLAITYPDQHRGAEVFASLQRMEAERFSDLEDAIYVTKDYRGKVKFHHAVAVTGDRASSDAVWSALIGSLFAAPVARRASAADATPKPGDYGIEERFVKDLGGNMSPGSSVIFVLLRNATPAEIMPRITKYGGTVVHSSLAPDAEQRLRAAGTARKP